MRSATDRARLKCAFGSDGSSLRALAKNSHARLWSPLLASMLPKMNDADCCFRRPRSDRSAGGAASSAPPAGGGALPFAASDAGGGGGGGGSDGARFLHSSSALLARE